MKERDDSDADEADVIAAYERGEFRPVNEQEKAKEEAVMAARRYIRKNAPKHDETRRVRCRIVLPKSMMRAARRLAERDHVSLNHWIGAAVAAKVSAAAAIGGPPRGQIQAVGDLLAPINADWTVDEDL
jgi:hypothetical protein